MMSLMLGFVVLRYIILFRDIYRNPSFIVQSFFGAQILTLQKQNHEGIKLSLFYVIWPLAIILNPHLFFSDNPASPVIGDNIPDSQHGARESDAQPEILVQVDEDSQAQEQGQQNDGSSQRFVFSIPNKV